MATATPRAVQRVLFGADRRKSDVIEGLELDQQEAIERAKEWLIKHAPEAIEGMGGDNMTYQVACRVRDFGLSEETCLELMAEHWNDTKADPPWPIGDLEQKVANAYQYAQEPAGVRSAMADFERVELETPAEGDPAKDGGTEKQQKKSHALPFWSFDPNEKPAPKQWLIKNVAAKGETAGWVGPPGSGKSAVVLDWFMHNATGRDWRGHKCKQQSAFVYFAFERALLTRRRILAYAKQWGLTDVPVAVVGQVLNLLDPRSVPVVWDTIKAVEDEWGKPVGAIALDTFPKGIAAGGGEENSAKDVNIVAANLRRLHEKVSVHIAAIGHTGKDESRGSRGSNANQGDWDVEYRISKRADGVKKVWIEKANDQEEGPVTAFLMKPYKLGVGEDLEDITTSIVSEVAVAIEQHEEPEDPLEELKGGLVVLGLKEFTTEDMKAIWQCSAATARRRATQLKDEDAIERVSQAVKGKDNKWAPARYRIKVK
jgi:hypothetical protein